jgi:DNA repair protein RecO (recombination protein O)
MWVWSDEGIVLSSKKHAEKHKIVDIFTKEHGKFSALYQVSKLNNFSIFSKVEVNYLSKNETSLGIWKLKSETQNWVYSLNSENHLLVCQGICFLLNRVLPYALPHKDLFSFMEYTVSNLQKFSSHSVLSLYACFEFVLLENVGFGIDLNDKNVNIPKLWLSWKKREFACETSNIDIKNSLKNTGNIIEKNVLHANNHFRSSICRLI